MGEMLRAFIPSATAGASVSALSRPVKKGASKDKQFSPQLKDMRLWESWYVLLCCAFRGWCCVCVSCCARCVCIGGAVYVCVVLCMCGLLCAAYV